MLTTILFSIAIVKPEIRWVDDQPKAVLAAIADGELTDDEWTAIQATEGYRRLAQREDSMKRPIDASEFREYLKSLASHREAYRVALERWSKLDLATLGAASASYLPKKATLKASIYPLIKPRTNSFVFDTKGNPAIMLYLEPTKVPEEIAQTVTHELHHIGYASCCPSESFKKWKATLSQGQQDAWDWIGAFGEGFAVLAAARDRNDPMGAMNQEVHDAWIDGMSNIDRDMTKVADFLISVIDGKLKGDEQNNVGMEFFGIQGSWYSLGYLMAIRIEDAFGRRELIRCIEDPRQLFKSYSKAIKKLNADLPDWPAELLKPLLVTK